MVKRSRAEAREELGRRIACISEEDFIRRYVLLPEYRAIGLRPGDVKVSTIQNDGTGPATVEYELGGSARLFAKLYMDPSGPHAYEVLGALWRAGFNRAHCYQVPEPLGFVAEHNLLLMRGAAGECLTAALPADGDQAVREAARWLLRLHASPVRVGQADQPWYMFSKLSLRLSKAAAAHPQEIRRLTAMVDQLEALAEQRADVELAQTHGQFRPIHVFLHGETITAIDLDRSLPADPAKDLAEFVHRLRSTLAGATGAAPPDADLHARSFLAEYAGERPSGLANLPFYHGFHVAASFCRHLKRLHVADPEWQTTEAFYAREFADAVSGRLYPSR